MGGTVGFNAWARAVHHRNCSLIWGLVPVILQSFIQRSRPATAVIGWIWPKHSWMASAQFHTLVPCLDTSNFSKLPPGYLFSKYAS